MAEGLAQTSSGMAISTEANPETTKSRAEALARNIVEGSHPGFAVGGTAKDGTDGASPPTTGPGSFEGLPRGEGPLLIPQYHRGPKQH